MKAQDLGGEVSSEERRCRAGLPIQSGSVCKDSDVRRVPIMRDDGVLPRTVYVHLEGISDSRVPFRDHHGLYFIRDNIKDVSEVVQRGSVPFDIAFSAGSERFMEWMMRGKSGHT